MPHMNGFELFLRLRDRYPHLPALFMSGYTAGTFAEGGELPPNSRFLAKPFLPQALLDNLRGLMGGQPARS